MRKRSTEVSTRRRTLATFAGLIMAVAVAVCPRSAEAAKSTECTDATWAEYNRCLVEARWEVQKKLCDLQFYTDMYACARESIAE